MIDTSFYVDARRYALIYIISSMMVSVGGKVYCMMKTVQPRIDSLKQGWNSPSLNCSTSD